MKRTTTFLLLALSLWNMAAAQDEARPGWLSNKPKTSNSTFFYVVERGSGATINEATNNALLKVFRTSMMRLGTIVSWDEVNSSLQKGADWGTVAMKYNIPINKVCEYVDKKTDQGYTVAVLCQVAKSGAEYPEFDEFTACGDTKSYNDNEAALKSAILPGLGQLGKNRKIEGFLTMGGEAVLLSGTTVFYLVGKGRISRIHTYANRPYAYYKYANQYNNLRSLNYTFGAAAAVLYVFNIYRAYTMTPRYKTDVVLVEPTLMQTDQSWATGLGITFNF